MKTQVQSRSRGFTLIEMVGVLAIIAILAALLIPRIMAALNEARLNNAVLSINTAKAAAISYFGKYGRFGGLQGIEVAKEQEKWDATLLQEGLLEKPFTTRLSTAADDPTKSFYANEVKLSMAENSDTVRKADDTAYNLDFDNDNTNDAKGKWVVEAVIRSVSLEDAIELNNRIDGDQDRLTYPLGESSVTTKGRVKFEPPAESSGLTDVYIYLAHK